MKTTTRWPWLIVALLLGFALLSAWSFHRAVKETSAVTDADYYSHGLRYNQTLLERQAAASLGWQVTSQLEGRVLTFRLRDRDQHGVTGALGTLHLLEEGNAYPRVIPLCEVEASSYQAELPAELHGEKAAEVAFQRDGAKLSQRLLFAIR